MSSSELTHEPLYRIFILFPTVEGRTIHNPPVDNELDGLIRPNGLAAK
jgi:hypothetical protein